MKYKIGDKVKIREDLEYIHYKEGKDPDLSGYIKLRFSNISSMLWTLDFIDHVNQANMVRKQMSEGPGVMERLQQEALATLSNSNLMKTKLQAGTVFGPSIWGLC